MKILNAPLNAHQPFFNGSLNNKPRYECKKNIDSVNHSLESQCKLMKLEIAELNDLFDERQKQYEQGKTVNEALPVSSALQTLSLYRQSTSQTSFQQKSILRKADDMPSLKLSKTVRFNL
jgi:hypothetical protein